MRTAPCQLLLGASLLVLGCCPVALAGINLERQGQVSKEQLLELDREVTNFYTDSYETLDARNVSYDEQLLHSIKSVRHTIVLYQYDYRYTDLEEARRSAGGRVNSALCRQQLSALLRMAERYSQEGIAPLSVADLLESSGRVEPGVMNGNFLWWGAQSSCERARIPAGLVRQFAGTSDAGQDIRGRSCMAHLKAKSWPEWDPYFEDRLSIKLGICVPDTCHTAPYLESEELRQMIASLARLNLVQPFNSERYQITYLYCLPDEDSQHRKWDLGTKLFVGFLALWLSLLLYANVRYTQRLQAVHQLRESIDIRMIINQRRESNGPEDDEDEDEDEDGPPQQQEVTVKGEQVQARPARGRQKEQVGQSLMPPEGDRSRASSAGPSPIPSDIEENDGEFRAIRNIVTDKRRHKSHKRPHQPAAATAAASGGQQSSGTEPDGIDLVEAFSIESNLTNLFKSRAGEARRSGAASVQGSPPIGRLLSPKRASQQLSSVSRRSSSSNEALIKRLQQYGTDAGDTRSKVAIVAAGQQQQQQWDGPRVDINILDGIKVLATNWIVYGHTLMFFFGLVTDLRFGAERMFDLTMVVSINTLQVVGLFYIITGCLLTYLAFSRQKVRQLMQPSFWLLVWMGRYIRLMPSYLLVFWFARHVAPHVGAGMFWHDYRTDTQHARGFCASQSWYTALTMSAADVKIPYDCVPQAWYLSNDFRTLLVLPVYIILLAKSPTVGYAAIFSTILFSTGRMVTIMRRAHVDFGVMLSWKPHVYAIMTDRLDDVYTSLAIRISTYLLGVVVGHLLYLYENKRIKQWPAWFRHYGLPVALLAGSVFFLGALVISSPYVNWLLPAAKDVPSDTVVLLIPIFKGAMELCMCTVLLLLATGGGYPLISEILSSRVAKVLSHISYGVFLVHVELLYKFPAHKIEMSYWYLFASSTFFICCSNAIALIIYLLYEMPINNLLRYLFKRLHTTFVGN